MSKVYKTVQGDMWDSISQKQYGDVKFADELINANNHFCDIYIFPDGVELIIPDIATSEQTDTLPPWKRVAG